MDLKVLLNGRLIIIIIELNIGLVTTKNAIQETSDFASVFTAANFVDNTMLIKALIEDSNKRILVTAPERSGRSTAMDMLRRFLEIPVDEKGVLQQTNTTFNYNLFKNNNLTLCKHETFFNEHFGKHPVISLHFQVLGKSSNYKELLSKFRDVLREVYIHHKYLLHHKHLWLDDLEVQYFNNFLQKNKASELTPTYMVKALPYLSEILNMHFGKPVVILVDDYDAFMDSLDFHTNPDIIRISHFLQRFYTGLLQSNRFVELVFLIGGLTRVPPTTFRNTLLSTNTITYNYLDKKPLSKFFNYIFT